MGKPKGKNGFLFYMIHKQQELRRLGEDLGLNHPRLQQLAGDEWKVMNTEEREPFNRRAKGDKERTRGQNIAVTPQNYSQRQGNFGRELVMQTNQINEDEDREQYLDKLVECCVKACKTTEDLINASFFVISSNVMIKTDSNEFYPLEIGICQYTIKEGIKFTYHQFIDAGRVPMGYMGQAKLWAEESHKIPFENFYPASNNYPKIVEEILQILENSQFTNEVTNKPTPRLVFCTEAQMEQNRGVLEWLARKYRAVVPGFDWGLEGLEVLDLVNLLYHTSNAVNTPIPLAMAEHALSTSAFDYSAFTNCDFHEEMDNKNCARGMARRYCYMLSESLCRLFDVTPTANHLPPKRDNVLADAYRVDLVEVRQPPAHRYHHNHDEQPEDWAPNDNSEQPSEQPSSSRPTPQLMGVGRGRVWNRSR